MHPFRRMFKGVRNTALNNHNFGERGFHIRPVAEVFRYGPLKLRLIGLYGRAEFFQIGFACGPIGIGRSIKGPLLRLKYGIQIAHHTPHHLMLLAKFICLFLNIMTRNERARNGSDLNSQIHDNE